MAFWHNRTGANIVRPSTTLFLFSTNYPLNSSFHPSLPLLVPPNPVNLLLIHLLPISSFLFLLLANIQILLYCSLTFFVSSNPSPRFTLICLFSYLSISSVTIFLFIVIVFFSSYFFHSTFILTSCSSSCPPPIVNCWYHHHHHLLYCRKLLLNFF